MFLLSRSWMVVIVAGLVLAIAGCQQKPPAKPTESSKSASKPTAAKDSSSDEQSAETPKTKHKPTVVKAKPEQPPPPPTIPKVELSNEIRAACLVGAGDTMPRVELPSPDGKMHPLESLAGHKLTVVCLWSIGTTRRSQLVSEGVLEDLTNTVAEPFAKKDVRVIGVCVGDPPEIVQEQVAKVQATFPVLLDPKGAYFAKLTKDKRMPRTYLLDGNGKILWFDVEFSNASRRDLIQGIRVALGEL